jgi:hypothetical protein
MEPASSGRAATGRGVVAPVGPASHTRLVVVSVFVTLFTYFDAGGREELP